MVLAVFYPSFSAKVIASLSIESIGVDYYALKNPFKHRFKPYTIEYMVSSFANSGNANTTLSNAAMCSYTKPH